MKHILYIILLMSLFTSCEEYFVPDIEQQESVLVFEGLITDEPQAHTVKITESVAYNVDKNPEHVSGYRVYIEDDLGAVILMNETDTEGVYETDDYVAGKIGRKYRMVATKNTGERYMSKFELLSEGLPIDTIDGRAEYETILKYYEGAGYVDETTRGMRVLNNVSGNKEKAFYRYEYDIVFQTTQYYPFQPFAYTAYIARPASSEYLNFISVLNCNLYAKYQAINNPTAFIDEEIMTTKITLPDIELDEDGEPIFEPEEIKTTGMGFLINLKQYSLSEESYTFWNNIYSQSNASGELFDPVETQIQGNMYNDNDTTRLVFGYFGASSVIIKGVHLKLRNNDKVQVKPLIYFPDLDGPIDSNVPFDFWVQ